MDHVTWHDIAKEVADKFLRWENTVSSTRYQMDHCDRMIAKAPNKIDEAYWIGRKNGYIDMLRLMGEPIKEGGIL